MDQNAQPGPVPTTMVVCHCGKKLAASPDQAGQKVMCPACRSVVMVPRGEATQSMRDSISAAGVSQATAGGDPPSNANLCDFLAPAQAPDELGRLGGYRVLKILGKGGMGVVFKAEDPHLRRFVALKAMLPGLALNPSAKERFFREARAAAALKHDHIVNIYQVGEDRGVPFLAMEFLEGEALDERLKRLGRLSIQEILRLGQQIAAGLSAAHQRGLIHRDIKPANIWLEARNQDARVKILDFGLARGGEDAHLTQTGMIMGTPTYMAPEQGRGAPVDARSDLWSLGVILYRMGTGKLPFQGADAISTLLAATTTNPAPPRHLNSAIPKGLSQLVMGLLAKNPQDRPASAQQVQTALQELEKDVPPEPPTQSFAVPPARSAEPPNQPPMSKPGWHHRTLWLVGGTILIMALFLGIWRPWAGGTSDEPKKKDVANSKDPPPRIKVAKKYPPSCIILWMGGGPSQLDTFDPKPLTPENMVFQAINTSVPGVQICDTLPNLAKQAHHLAIIRTLQSREGDHARGTYLMRTGHTLNEALDFPSLGCVLGKELRRPGLPGYMRFGGGFRTKTPPAIEDDEENKEDKSKKKKPVRVANPGGPAFLGEEYGPVYVGTQGPPRLEDFPRPDDPKTKTLLYNLLPAFNLTKTQPRDMEKYGIGFGYQCFMAGRLVNLGVPVVEITLGGWDHHANIPEGIPRLCSILDQAWSALLTDLEASGRLESTLIVWMGEFGRNPWLNANRGRDHHGAHATVVLAGGLIKGGQVIGKTSDDGVKIIERPVSVEELYATIYSALGIDPAATLTGPGNLQLPLVERGTKPLSELLP